MYLERIIADCSRKPICLPCFLPMVFNSIVFYPDWIGWKYEWDNRYPFDLFTYIPTNKTDNKSYICFESDNSESIKNFSHWLKLWFHTQWMVFDKVKIEPMFIYKSDYKCIFTFDLPHTLEVQELILSYLLRVEKDMNLSIVFKDSLNGLQ